MRERWRCSPIFIGQMLQFSSASMTSKIVRMSEPAVDPSKQQSTDSKQVFFRLLRMLKPYRMTITIGIIFLLISAPAELFPAFVWRYVTDDIVLQKPSSPLLHQAFSFGGRIADRYQLLFS